jgi:hypothetical protein
LLIYSVALADAQRAKQRENKQKQREKKQQQKRTKSGVAASRGGERAASSVAASAAAGGGARASALAPATLPSDWKQWPVVLTTTGALAPAARLCVPEEAFDALPPTLQVSVLYVPLHLRESCSQFDSPPLHL